MNLYLNGVQLRQRNKVRNILIRYCGNKTVEENRLADKNYQHPENAYLVRYYPKYYQSLTLIMKRQNSLLSKIKRIKKLRRFTGNFNRQTPRVDWFKILANNRKEIEELPQILLSQPQRFFWKKAVVHVVKFFFQITKLHLPPFDCWELRPEVFLMIWKTFSKYLENLRRLKVLKINMNESDSGILMQLLKKLNEMPRLLGKLEVLQCPLRSNVSSEILQNKTFLSHLTNLNTFSVFSELSPICLTIPQACNNLRAFSLMFLNKLLSTGPLMRSHFLNFVTAMQELPKLQSISISWSSDCSYDIWCCFIPPPSLRNLELRFPDVDLAAFRNFTEKENFIGRWKEIEKLDALNFYFECKNGEDMVFTKEFITKILKKISSLSSFSVSINLQYDGVWRYEPFEIEEVPHLYEDLKKFNVLFSLGKVSSSVRFDFGILKPFKNMNEVDFWGFPCSWVNIGDAVLLFERNARKGGFSTLKLGEITISYPEELKDLLKKISKAKKDNVKIMLALKFQMEISKSDEIKYLGQFCEIIESRTVKGLEILFDLRSSNCSSHHFDELKRVLERYPGLRNFVLKFRYGRYELEYIKRDGEKEQLLLVYLN